MKSLISLCAALLALPLAAQITPERLKEDPALAMDVYHVYEYSPSKTTRPPRGYKAVYVSHYGRHGERYINRSYYLYPGLDVLQRSELTPLGERAKKEISGMIRRCEGNWGALSPLGAKNHREIAKRIFKRNRRVFRSGREVRCVSTTKPRCIISMANAAGALAVCRPGLKIDLRTNDDFLCYVQPGEVREHLYELRDSMFAAHPGVYDCLRDCFADPAAPDAKALAEVAEALFFTWKGLPSIGLEQFDIRDFFSEQMLLLTARHYAAWDYCLLSRSPWWHREWLDPIIDDIIARADEALEKGTIAADLRFGHDSQLIPLYTALGLTSRWPVKDYAECPDFWDPASICPMASSLQIEFYRKKNAPVLMKLLQNEREVFIPDLTPVKGPYYLWTDLADLLKNGKTDYHVCAYVWPSCHDDSLAHKWLWADGEGEWEVIKKGNPRFEGHYQPKQPLWGYELDDDPQVVEKWIKTALKYGVNTFIYDWYWYNAPDGWSGPYLEDALDKGFLGAPSNRKMNFYIMYANHDVKYSYWNYHKWGADADSLLFNPRIGMEDWKKVVHRVITQYFHLPNYVKIDGCPVFAMFNADIFKQGFASDEEAAAAMEYFREEVRKAGFPGLHLQLTPGGGSDPSAKKQEHMRENIALLGINSIAFYNMGGFDCDYVKHNENAVRMRNATDAAYDIPLFPTVSIGWDDTPRFPAKGEKHVTRFNHSPEVFANYLQIAKDYADAHRDTQPPFVMINAWNEWVEGSYLLPDKVTGFGYLEQVKKVLR